MAKEAKFEFTKRFHKNAQCSEFVSAFPRLGETLLSVLHSGPSFHKKYIIPLNYTTKSNIWRIRVNIQPVHRLYFEWINKGSQPVLRLITFIPKKHRYCDPKNSSEIEKLAGALVDGPEHSTLEAKIRNLTTDVNAEKEEIEASKAYAFSHKLPANVEFVDAVSEVTNAEFNGSVMMDIEPAAPEDLIDIYATRELIQGFANYHGYSPEQRRMLVECTTTDEALAVLDQISPAAKDRFISFLLDQDAPDDLQRFYKLGGDDFIQLARRPVSSFHLSVDEEQQEAIDKPLGNRPFMVAGSAGTGKTIVCLYRLLRLAQNRTNETLFDGADQPTYLYVSYTNALVASSERLFTKIAPPDVQARFATLDEIFSEVAEKFRKRGIPIPRPDKYASSTAYHGTLRDLATPTEEKRLLEEVGCDFFNHEVDEVLVDRDVNNLSDYLETGKRKELRRGLIVPLREEYRRAIWRAYERLLENEKRTKNAPFSLYRKRILNACETYPEMLPKYNCVIADEIQDFGEIQLGLLVSLVKSPAGLILARDPGQTIYRRRTSLQSIEPRLRFDERNSVLLKRSYRMTKAIHEALAPLRIEISRVRNQSEEVAIPVFTGQKPRWLVADSLIHFELICEDILSRIQRNEGNPGHFAVLFATNTAAEQFHEYCRKNGNLPTALHKSRDFLDPDAELIQLMTAHSAKGLEFPHVYLPRVCELVQPKQESSSRFDLDEQVDSGVKLLYVAGSRALVTLTILQEKNISLGVLDLLNKDKWDCQTITD